MRGLRFFLYALSAILLGSLCLWASINGSISGVVTDSSGAVVSGATVTATNTQTGVKSTLKTDSKGFYNFPALQVGTYSVDVQQPGFKTESRTALVIDANSALRADFTLQVGQIIDKVTVESEAEHVETESTQMGEVITAKTITAVPLNGRAYTDLLALQPGVSPYTATDTGSPGISDRAVDGGLNSGNQSVNGQRETANGFMVNGSNVEEGKNNGAAIIPNLDSIQEFRIITNNFDAEYGNYSGGQVNVVTKSGTNGFHGSGFEFLRNTSLDAKNYYAASTDKTPVFRQNQFGGTFGGPIVKDKTFFFVDYQATRQTQAPTVNTQLPSLANFGGDFSQEASADAFSTTQSLNGQNVQVASAVNGPGFAAVLTQRTGNANIADGFPYYFQAGDYNPGSFNTNPQQYATNCTSSTQCVFPNGIISTAAWSPVATAVLNLGLIPHPNAANNFFETSAYAQKLRDDKGGIRIDQNTRFGNFFAYYFADDYSLDSPFPNGGASVPAAQFAYSGLTTGRAQLINLGNTKNFGYYSVNEVRLSYVRNTLDLGQPGAGVGPDYSLSKLGFVTPWSTPGGISPIVPQLEGVPYFGFNNFSIGVPTVTTRQINNSFQVLDNFTRVYGTHTIKFGGQFHYDQIDERNLAAENGQYGFSGSETGIDFADFLIGAPDSLTQASPQLLDSRSKYYALFGQDSWRVTPSLVFNYGLRWEASMPWYDTQNKTETIIPGKQSAKFPGAPLGYVVAGDPGVPRTLGPTQWHNFSPRLGLAYSPGASSGIMGKLFGGPGHTSIRVGAGLYYTSVEDLSQFLEVGDPPYGLYYGSSAPPLLEAPYITRSSGTGVGQRFPIPFPSTNVSASNPDTTFPWGQVEPLSYDWSFDNRNKLPYSEHYELSIERQITSKTIASISYVGNQGHRLVSGVEANPANQALCLMLSVQANLAPNSAPPCGQFSETPQFTYAPGQIIPMPWVTSPTAPIPDHTYISVRPLGPFFDTNPYVSTVSNSRYNSLQGALTHQAGSLTLSAGYTFSKCMDNASALQESIDPFDPSRSVGLCNFDVTHSLVFSYDWILPFDRMVSSGWAKRVASGWTLSGITRFATGLPISLSEDDDASLIGANAAGLDVPNYSGGGKVLGDTNPRDGQPYFNVALFTPEQLGVLGNSRRRFFHGPGLNNWDMTLAKVTKITESKQLELRVEAFNLFNHAQFGNPDGDVNSSSFGIISSVRDPRIMQLGARFTF
ncbi:MAG TPA: carboxypeptidase regulatory-like domain-containing protein [Terriglobales bacterium]|nr:carboxypeptidase regulatory-like domain-containing protein [Terriglobales bacterium]